MSQNKSPESPARTTRLIADSCLEGAKTFKEKLRAKEVADAADKEVEEKKVSRFEGDIDLQGVDIADLEAQEQQAEAAAEGETSTDTPAVVGALLALVMLVRSALWPLCRYSITVRS